MAVCNLFSDLKYTSGNFMLFSQYVEDITAEHVKGDDWKVVPTRFVALDIDYSKINSDKVLKTNDINSSIPAYFQNYFENSCAYGRVHYNSWEYNNSNIDWNASISRNLFWNAMYEGGFITIQKYLNEDSNVYYTPEIVYYGDINMHSHNYHKGMGYGEIYCYIPTDAEKVNCKVEVLTPLDSRKSDTSNKNPLLEGHTDEYVGTYNLPYFYNEDFVFEFEDVTEHLPNSNAIKYGINTIVVLYTIFKKVDNKWQAVHANIPLGLYIAGKLENNVVTNPITKYVTTNYGSGTSYGLRICTRFTATGNGAILTDNEVVTDDSGYTNVCQLMTAMNENLSRMLEVSKSAINTTQSYKDLLSIFKNNRTNVPYVREVNGKDFWFVNGRLVSSVIKDDLTCCNELSASTVSQRLENLMDNDPENDYTPIDDPNSCGCNPINIKDLASHLGLDPSDYNDIEYTIPINIETAKPEDVIGTLTK